MKLLAALPLVAALAAAFPLAAHAGDGVDAKTRAFDARVFGGPVGDKASACFVRSYDARHLAQHPRQKVSLLKLLVTAEKAPGEPTSYAFHLGVQFRNRPGNFDGGSTCEHLVGEDNGREIIFSCHEGCESLGLEIALSKNNKSIIVRLDSIPVWPRGQSDGEKTETLQGGTDDKVFRVERVDNKECDELVADRAKVAELQHD